jgi:hypothetical protein
VASAQLVARAEAKSDQDVGNEAPTLARRRAVRARIVLTQPPPAPPVPPRPAQGEDEPGDTTAPRPTVEVVADIDRVLGELEEPLADPPA